MSSDYIPGAEPLFIDGNKRGCLLLHGGGGGTTWDLKEFANILHADSGMTVWLPALTGYGTKPEDLYEVTFDDWLSDAHKGLDKLLEQCEDVHVVGHSAGGLISLILASEREEVSALVTWAAPFSVQSRLLLLLPVISKIPGFRRAIPEKHPTGIPNWLREQGWVGYDWIPPSVGLVVRDGMKRLKKALGRIRCSALIIQGSEDKAVTEDSPRKIYDGLASEKREIWIVEGAGHPMMNDERYKAELFTRTITFLVNE
ncbi:MAG: alpha/beta hydrolase [Candidatus Thorarchaeota archaeon]|jgi:carboxylesterase